MAANDSVTKLPLQISFANNHGRRLAGVLIYSDGGWPLWLRVLIAVFAAVLFAVLAWRYYVHFWRR